MNLRIKEIIKEKGITITMLAEMVGVTQANMSLIVNEKSNPQLKTLQRVADALQVPINELFTERTEDTVTCPHCGGKIQIIKA